jgi:hypothetical protein
MTQSRSRAVVQTLMRIAGDLLSLVPAAVRSHAHLAAENLFLRKQLALYVERQAKPRRADDTTRIVLIMLSRLIEWRPVLRKYYIRASIWRRQMSCLAEQVMMPAAEAYWRHAAPPTHERRAA